MTCLQPFYYPLLNYSLAWDLQKHWVQAKDGTELRDVLLLMQHPPTYTVGTTKEPGHLLLSEEQLAERGIQVVQIDRGGDITYHGPGQLVGYPIVYLEPEGLDLHQYLRNLEQVIINFLAELGVTGTRKPQYTGVWVEDRKIAAIGVKFNKCRSRRGYITSHGFAVNILNGLDGFEGIVPCGIREFDVTTLEACTGAAYKLEAAAERISVHFASVFARKLLNAQTILP